MSQYPYLSVQAQTKAQGPPPLKVSTAESEKYAVYRDMPCVSGAMHALGLFGSVAYEFTVTTAGKMVDIKTVAGNLKGNAETGKLGKECLSRCQYRPCLVNGKATAIRTTVVYAFQYAFCFRTQLCLGSTVGIELGPQWVWFFSAYLVLAAANAALAAASLLHPYWTVRRAAMRLLSDCTGGVLFCWLLRARIVTSFSASSLTAQ
jgi:hypothetical protein